MAFIDKIFQSVRFYKNSTLLAERPNLRFVTGRDILSFNSSFSSLDVDLTDIEDQADQLEADMSDLSDAVAALDLSGLETAISDLESDIVDAETDIATNAADNTTNANNNTTNAAAIAVNAAAISDNAEAIAVNAAAISDNTDAIAANAAAIAQNTSDISDNADDIAALQVGTSPVGAPLRQWLRPLPYALTGENSFNVQPGWGPTESTTNTAYSPDIGSGDLPHWVFGSAGAGLALPVEVPIGATSVTVTIYACTDSTDDNGIDLQLDGRDLHDNVGATPASHTIATPNTTLGSDTSAPTAEVIATSKALSELAWVAGELSYMLLTRESTSNADSLQVVAIKLQFA